MKHLWIGLCVVILAVSGIAAPTASPVEAPPVRTATTLDAEMRATLEARDVALAEIAERYRTAAPEQRTALEAEGSELQAQYERAYLSLAVEYHRLAGNAVEMERAERMLEAMDAAPRLANEIHYTNTDRNLPDAPAPVTAAPAEGVIQDAR